MQRFSSLWKNKLPISNTYISALKDKFFLFEQKTKIKNGDKFIDLHVYEYAYSYSLVTV